MRSEKAYHYRGLIERLRIYGRGTWIEGYSSGDLDIVHYPWIPRRQCRQEAKRDGFKAVFYRNGEREKPARRKCSLADRLAARWRPVGGWKTIVEEL